MPHFGQLFGDGSLSDSSSSLGTTKSSISTPEYQSITLP
uniref:Uncharacterized protein LOC8283401 n=1 Tax=Rhizophora mucronata TaxID=61149 RepID=A0A2P2MQ53_RHIMU